MSIFARANYNSLVGSGRIRYVTYPTAAAAVTATGGKSWAYGAWAQIVAGATMTADYWICGVFVTAVAVDSFELDCGVGAGGSETTRATLPFDGNDVSGAFLPLPYPIKVEASTRLAVRVANASAAVANTLDAKVTVATNVGS